MVSIIATYNRAFSRSTPNTIGSLSFSLSLCSLLSLSLAVQSFVRITSHTTHAYAYTLSRAKTLTPPFPRTRTEKKSNKNFHM